MSGAAAGPARKGARLRRSPPIHTIQSIMDKLHIFNKFNKFIYPIYPWIPIYLHNP